MKFFGNFYKKTITGSSFHEIAVFLVLSLFLISCGTADGGQSKGSGKAITDLCSETAKNAFKACKNEGKVDFWIATGNCNNLSSDNKREKCLDNADEELDDVGEECGDQKEARLEICDGLGESAYDPVIDPDDYVDFEKVVDGTEGFTPNTYFPLVPGSVREYLVKDTDGTTLEKLKVEVLEESKEILGVNCIVVRDRVWEVDEDGEEVLIEDTLDWYAQDLTGNVWYFGEIALNYEDGELVDIEGSWKSGRDFAKAGILMKAAPTVGDFYRQEFLLGDAEDMGEVLSTTGSADVPAATCTGDCVVTRDFTPIEPDVEENKYYAPNIGVILEVDIESGERVELISHGTL